MDEVEFDKRNAEEKDALGDRLLGMFFTGIGNSMHYTPSDARMTVQNV